MWDFISFLYYFYVPIIMSMARNNSSERLLKAVSLFFMRVIHAQPRIAPSPINNKRVDRNPPPLLWPAERGEDVRYAVRLSQVSQVG